MRLRATISITLSFRSIRPNRRKHSSNAAVIAARSCGRKATSFPMNWHVHGVLSLPYRREHDRSLCHRRLGLGPLPAMANYRPGIGTQQGKVGSVGEPTQRLGCCISVSRPKHPKGTPPPQGFSCHVRTGSRMCGKGGRLRATGVARQRRKASRHIPGAGEAMAGDGTPS